MPTHIDKYFPLFLKLRSGFSRTISFLAQISFGIENTARLSRTVCFLAKISVGIEVLHPFADCCLFSVLKQHEATSVMVKLMIMTTLITKLSNKLTIPGEQLYAVVITVCYYYIAIPEKS